MVIAEGKTKTILPGPEENTVILETKDILTGGDAAKRETISGISIHKTTQCANVFSLLNRNGLPTAFIRQHSQKSLLCHRCDMVPLELVMRRFAWGSILRREPGYKQEDGKPYRFSEVLSEFFHKWSVVTRPLSSQPYQVDEDEARKQFLRDGTWQEGVYTDPYIRIEDGRWILLPAKKNLKESKALMEIDPLFNPEEYREIIEKIMIPSFRVLEKAWQNIETVHGAVTLVDLKIEVGRRLGDGKLVIADVIDNDSWRIWPGGDPGKQLDKQCFREGHPLSSVAENYALVAELTKQFLDS